jgi:hypothetical protein
LLSRAAKLLRLWLCETTAIQLLFLLDWEGKSHYCRWLQENVFLDMELVVAMDGA